MKFFKGILLTFLIILITGNIEVSARTINGIVTDSVTGENLGYVNVYFKKAKGGTLTDNSGNFTFTTPFFHDIISVSSLGYNTYTTKVDSSFLNIRLSPTTVQLAELVVNPGKQKYSKKNNPAVQLMERIRKNAPNHDPRKKEFYSADKEVRMALGLNDYHFENEANKGAGKYDFLKEYVDTSLITGLPYLALSVKETIATDIYSSFKGHKEIIRAKRSNGIDEAFNQENISMLLDEIFREVDIYNNDITLMSNKFVSPLSHIGANYYKYFITDTLQNNGNNLIELTFVPHNPESFGFNGRLYVEEGDSVTYVKKLVMRVPASINLNYVRNLYIIQDFSLDNNGLFHKDKDLMGVELQIIPGTQIFYAERYNHYGNYNAEKSSDSWEDYFAVGGESVILPNAESMDDTFWNENRLIPLSDENINRPSLIARLREIPVFYWAEKILTILVTGYIKTNKESIFDFGPVNTLVSTNTVEGVRFRLGGVTTANLSKRWFARGYVAYGTKDKKLKYRAETEWSFIDKKYHSREFPVNTLRLSHEYDYDMIGQHYLFTNADNIFLSWKREKNDKFTMRRISRVDYIYENPNGWSFEIGAVHQRQQPTPWLTFEKASSTPDKPRFLRHYDSSYLYFKLRFAPNEKFVQSTSERIPINFDAPIITLTHEYGPAKLLGSDYEINRSELSIQKRFWFSVFGYTDIILKGGIIWSSVFYPALMWPNANLSYTIQPESYSLMNPMEFATDHYFSWDITYWGNGILFNRIPLIKKTKIREVITFKGLMGGLNKRNNPSFNKNLLAFPEYVKVNQLSLTPYMELSAGIDNILTILRVDYVWRLSYKNITGISNSGLRISLHFNF
ncbi:MAG: DUF5686 and carboxypeptidase regulatory-like domain-containing protein [Prevotella sp.]|nr:DUF5686 and carboxypeptidase regulatory-like domain-containing protein [Bacteroides sp.]MCM1365855.1 DUF5686 and carboxypeptidase regulatory-like domain-containing protein [Prevotella sp.]